MFGGLLIANFDFRLDERTGVWIPALLLEGVFGFSLRSESGGEDGREGGSRDEGGGA